jgi:protein transport protein SEC13
MAPPSHQEMNGGNRIPPNYSVDTEHNDMVNDIQLDYYGKRMVTCSSDRTFRIYDVSSTTSAANSSSSDRKQPPNTQKDSGPVLEHVVQLPEDSNAPVHRVSWAHPKFGSLVALACQDGQVYIYREELHPSGAGTLWALKYIHVFHTQAVLSIAWAPYEYGLCLASASADSQVSFLTRMKEGWVVTSSFINTDDVQACTSVSWAPYNSLGSQGPHGPIQRVVTGSINTSIRIWKRGAQDPQWSIEQEGLYGHQDWVRDVAWAPNVGVPVNVIASASEDQTVRIWSQDENNGPWKEHILHTFHAPVYRISCSLTGSILSAATGDDQVTFWKQLSETEWIQLSSVNEMGAQVVAN